MAVISKGIAKHMHELPAGWSEWNTTGGTVYSANDASGAVISITPARGKVYTVINGGGEEKCFKSLDRALAWGQTTAAAA